MVKKLAPLTGVLFFVLLLVSSILGGNSPSADWSGARVLAHYQAHRTSLRVSGELIVIAVVVGVVFYGLLRAYLRRDQDSRPLTAVAFGGVILFAVSGGLNAGVEWALTDAPTHLSPAAAQALNLVQTDVVYALELGGIAILFLAFGLAILRSGLLPKWLGWVAMPLALVALIPPIGFVSFIAAGIWTLIVAIVMWLRTSGEGARVAAAGASL
jgi:hypothetical protein